MEKMDPEKFQKRFELEFGREFKTRTGLDLSDFLKSGFDGDAFEILGGVDEQMLLDELLKAAFVAGMKEKMDEDIKKQGRSKLPARLVLQALLHAAGSDPGSIDVGDMTGGEFDEYLEKRAQDLFGDRASSLFQATTRKSSDPLPIRFLFGVTGFPFFFEVDYGSKDFEIGVYNEEVWRAAMKEYGALEPVGDGGEGDNGEYSDDMFEDGEVQRLSKDDGLLHSFTGTFIRMIYIWTIYGKASLELLQVMLAAGIISRELYVYIYSSSGWLYSPDLGLSHYPGLRELTAGMKS